MERQSTPTAAGALTCAGGGRRRRRWGARDAAAAGGEHGGAARQEVKAKAPARPGSGGTKRGGRWRRLEGGGGRRQVQSDEGGRVEGEGRGRNKGGRETGAGRHDRVDNPAITPGRPRARCGARLGVEALGPGGGCRHGSWRASPGGLPGRRRPPPPPPAPQTLQKERVALAGHGASRPTVRDDAEGGGTPREYEALARGAWSGFEGGGGWPTVSLFISTHGGRAPGSRRRRLGQRPAQLA